MMYGNNVICTTFYVNVIIFIRIERDDFGICCYIANLCKGKFCSEMLATHSLVQIDVVKEIKINCKF